ncbi:MAG: glycosyltransferase [Candidatus Dormiibacterota bacterium]
MTQQAGRESSKFLSFVIPTRDEAGYIEVTLAALAHDRALHGLDFDIIVADGGSHDSTVALSAAADIVVAGCERAARNIASGRNVGVERSIAAIIFNTDADVFVPQLEALYKDIVLHFADPAVVAAVTRLEPYPWAATWMDRCAHRVINRAIRLAIPMGAFLARGECLIMRRSAFDVIGGFDERLALCEDADLLRRLRRVGKVRFLADRYVYHSPRRFHACGYTRCLGYLIREIVWLRILHRPYLTQWKVIR